MKHMHNIGPRVHGTNLNGNYRLLLLFGMEGLLYQFMTSIAASNGFGTNLYATNLGATDSQIGMIQLVANLLAAALLIPVGIVCDRTKRARTMPVAMLFFLGIMYFFYATVPAMGAARMIFFFVFVALTAGVLSAYNSIWQAFFSEVTPIQERNSVYTFRNRCIFIVSTVAPIVCGSLLTAMPDTAGKLRVLRIFFYICGALSLVAGFVLRRISDAQRSSEMLQQVPRFSLAELRTTVSGLARDRRFMIYFGCIMCFYMAWHLDWSMWYIGQVQYLQLTEAQMSICTAVVSVCQLLTMGIFVRFSERRGSRRMFFICALATAGCSLLMVGCTVLPLTMRPAVFIILCAALNCPTSVNALCLLQLMLEVIPKKNRALVISLHMTFVTLSNALLPYLGVQLYNALGADTHAFITFYWIDFALRGGAAMLNGWRIRHLQRIETSHQTSTC